ncbi:MAG: hypothetical protein JNK00_00245 [Flavipsychrobacter sp.]|nr:hypothetical protein [Flavipsychrobacter sp.]
MNLTALFNPKANVPAVGQAPVTPQLLQDNGAEPINPEDIILREAQRENETVLFNLNQDGRAERAGLIVTNAAPIETKAEEEKKRKKERSFNDWMTMLRNAKSTLADLGRDIDRTLSQAEKYLQELKEILAERRAMDAAKALLEDGGVIERDENGQIKDPNLKRVVERWQKKTGAENVDDDALILAIINKELPAMPTEQQLEKSIKTQEMVVKSLKGHKNTCDDLAQKGEGIENASDEKKQEFLDDVNNEDAKARALNTELQDILNRQKKGLIDHAEVERQSRETIEKYDYATVTKFRIENPDKVSMTDEARKDKVESVSSSKASDLFADDEPENMVTTTTMKPISFAPS